MNIIILAGGGGTRLWPISTSKFPKQFVSIAKKESLLQQTFRRFHKASIVENILIVTSQEYAPLVEDQLSEIDSEKKTHILVEPYQKDTAPAIALSVKYLEEKLSSSKSNCLVVPSDHLISPEADFLTYLGQIENMLNSGYFMTFGIKPTRAETGYGYIKIGEPLESSIYHVDKFVEKPDHQKAEEYLKDGCYVWNSGMFAFTVTSFWDELAKHALEIYKYSSKNLSYLMDNFSRLPNISIDYALMEKTKKLLVCPLDIFWSDVGSWDSVYEILEKDENQNVKLGNVVDVDTKNSLIIGSKRLISTIGLEDVLIVETSDVVFIAKRGESQKVKALLGKLHKRSTLKVLKKVLKESEKSSVN